MLKNPFTSLFGNRGVERSQTRQQPRSREEAIEMGFGTAPAPYIPPEIQEAIDLRKDANDSREIATDQYESDVADFKNNLATEKEKGIASLPQAPVMTPRREEPIFTPPPPVFRDEPIFTPPPPVFREEPIFTPPPPPSREEPIFTPPFEDEPIFTPPPPPSREEPIFTPPPPPSFGGERPPIFDDEPIYTPPPRFDDIGTPGGPDFNGNINFPGAGTNPPGNFFDNIFTPTPPPTDPVDPSFGGDGTFPNIDFPGLDQDALDELLERLKREGVIPPGDRSGDTRGIYDPPDDPPDEIILPPPLPPLPPTPPPPPPSGPINPYTGEAMRNPYTPYEQPSNESNFNRAQMMDPRRFGQAPGFEPPRNPILKPIKLPPGDGRRPPKPPQVPPPDDRLFPEKAKGMNMGGGISQLPMQGQGDTLTTQVFQAGFRPRR